MENQKIDKIATIMFVIAILSLSLLIYYPNANPKHTVETNKLHSIQSTILESGSFWLILGTGTGKYSEKITYIYYEELENGSLRLQQIRPNDKTFIFEDEESNPYVNKIFKETLKKELMKTEFHIPKGSIKKDINLDLDSLK